LSFVNYANALANWLEPYHDYARPPPAVVLAEAAKQTELKTGYPLKGVDLTSLDGLSTNGNGKKDEEPPAVTEAPELVLKFFDGEKVFVLLRHMFNMVGVEFKTRLSAVSKGSVPSTLHIATLAQEVRLSLG
jgi:N-terminal acetyltransferase B complex non-catalytic subunit